jgi:hypothetical protein
MVEEAWIVTVFMMKKRVTMIRYQRLLMLGVSTMILIVETPSIAGQESQTDKNSSMPKQFLKVFVDEKDGNERFLLKNKDTSFMRHKNNIKKTDKNVLLHKALTDAYSYGTVNKVKFMLNFFFCD